MAEISRLDSDNHLLEDFEEEFIEVDIRNEQEFEQYRSQLYTKTGGVVLDKNTKNITLRYYNEDGEDKSLLFKKDIPVYADGVASWAEIETLSGVAFIKPKDSESYGPDVLKFNAATFAIENPTYKWILNDEVISTDDTCKVYEQQFDRSVTLTLIVNDVYKDFVTLYKLEDGKQGNAVYNFILSNENFSIACDENNIITNDTVVSIDVLGKFGSEDMQIVKGSESLKPNAYWLSVKSSSDSLIADLNNSTVNITPIVGNRLDSTSTIKVSIEYMDTLGNRNSIGKIIYVSSSSKGKKGENAIILNSLEEPGSYEGQVGFYNGKAYSWYGGWIDQFGDLPTASLIHYSFDGYTTDHPHVIIDNSGHQYNVKREGGHLSGGIYGSGFRLEQNKNFSIGSDKKYSENTLTLAFWCQGNNLSFYDKTQGIEFTIKNTGFIFSSNGQGKHFVYKYDTSVSPNNFIHYVVIFNLKDGTVTFYMNNEKCELTKTYETPWSYTVSFPFTIVSSGSDTLIDDVHIFDYELSENQVKGLYLAKGNTPVFFTNSDYSLMAIDDDSKISPSEKKDLRLKLNEVIAERISIEDNAREQGISTDKNITDYLTKADELINLLREYTLEMDTVTDITTPLDDILRDYTNLYIEAQNAVTMAISLRSNSISIVQSNANVSLPVDDNGNVSFDFTDNTIELFAGAQRLVPVNRNYFDSRDNCFYVEAKGINVDTPKGSPSSDGYFFTPLERIEPGMLSGSVEYDIIAKLNGSEFKLTCRQKVTLSSRGADAVSYRIETIRTIIRDTMGSFNPSYFTIQAYAWNATTPSHLTNECNIVVYQNDREVKRADNFSELNVNVAELNPSYPVVIKLEKGNDSVYDIESIAFLNEVKGDKGDGLIGMDTIYKLATSLNGYGSIPSSTDSVWTGSATASTSAWGTKSASVTANAPYLYRCFRRKYANNESFTYEVSTPELINTYEPEYYASLSMTEENGSAKLTVYKNGTLFTETLYYKDYYAAGSDSAETCANPVNGTVTGTVDIAAQTANKHLVKIFKDSARTNLLCSVFTSFGAGEDSTSYWLIEDIGTIRKKADGTYYQTELNVNAKQKKGEEGVSAYSGRIDVEYKSASTGGWVVAKSVTASSVKVELGNGTGKIPLTADTVRCSLYDSNGTLLDQDQISVVEDGKDNVYIDLDNEFGSIATKNGRTQIVSSFTTTLKIFRGTEEQTITDITVTGATPSTTADIYYTKSGNRLTFTIKNNIALTRKNITITAISSAGNRTATFTLQGVEVGADSYSYSIQPSVDIIHKDKNGEIVGAIDGYYGVTCNVIKNTASGEVIDNYHAGYTLEYAIDNGTFSAYDSTKTRVRANNKFITFRLLKGNVVVDYEKILILADGQLQDIKDEVENQLPGAIKEQIEQIDFEEKTVQYTPVYRGPINSISELPSDITKDDWILDKSSNPPEIKKWNGTELKVVEYSTSTHYMFSAAASDCISLALTEGEIGTFTLAYIGALFVNKIELQSKKNPDDTVSLGAIYGGKYDENGNLREDKGDKGVYLDGEGQFKCTDGQFEGNIQSSNFKVLSTEYTFVNEFKYRKWYVQSKDSETTDWANTIEETPSIPSGTTFLGYELGIFLNGELITNDKKTKIFSFTDTSGATGIIHSKLCITDDDNEINYSYWDGTTIKPKDYIFTETYYSTLYEHNIETYNNGYATFNSQGYKVDKHGNSEFYGSMILGKNALFLGDIVNSVMEVTSDESTGQEYVYTANTSMIPQMKVNVTGTYGNFTFDSFVISIEDSAKAGQYYIYKLKLSLYKSGILIYSKTKGSSAIPFYKIDYDLIYKEKGTGKIVKFKDLPTRAPAEKNVLWVDGLRYLRLS